MKRISWLAVVVFLMALLVFYYVNRPAPSVEAQAPDFELTLSQIFEDLESKPDTTLKKLIDKVVLIEGFYNSQSGDKEPVLIIHDEQGRLANCSLDGALESVFEKGEKIRVKGVFIGFDELFGEVQLNKCHIE